MIDDPNYTVELHTEEIRDLDTQLQSLDQDDEEYDQKHSTLRAERKRLVKLDDEAEKEAQQNGPSKVPARHPDGSIKTIGEEWAERDEAGKREFLLDRGCEIQVIEGKTRGANGRERNLPVFSISFGDWSHVPKVTQNAKSS